MNFKHLGHVSTLDELYEETHNDILDRPSMRELLPNQAHTRNSIGLYNVLNGVEAFGNYDVFMAYYPLLHEVTSALKQWYGYTHVEYRSLMVVKLLAGQEIAEHIDEGGIYNVAHRIHVPIYTNEECVFTVGGEEYRMAAGEIVEIDNTVPHSVKNGGADRVHLIMDVIGIHQNYNVAALKTPVPPQFYYEEM